MGRELENVQNGQKTQHILQNKPLQNLQIINQHLKYCKHFIKVFFFYNSNEFPIS